MANVDLKQIHVWSNKTSQDLINFGNGLYGPPNEPLNEFQSDQCIL